MAIPRRFAPPNPAADELRARAEALPPEQKAEVEAALPGGGQAVSLAMPGQAAPNPATILPPSSIIPPPSVSPKISPSDILNSLVSFSSPKKNGLFIGNNATQRLIEERGLVIS